MRTSELCWGIRARYNPECPWLPRGRQLPVELFKNDHFRLVGCRWETATVLEYFVCGSRISHCGRLQHRQRILPVALFDVVAKDNRTPPRLPGWIDRIFSIKLHHANRIVFCPGYGAKVFLSLLTRHRTSSSGTTARSHGELT